MILEKIDFLVDLNLRSRGAQPSAIAFNPNGYYLFMAEFRRKFTPSFMEDVGIRPVVTQIEEFKGMKIMIVDPLDATSDPMVHLCYSPRSVM